MEELDKMIDSLGEKMWAKSEHFFAPSLVKELYDEAHQLYESGALQSADIGKEQEKQSDHTIRKTQIFWFQPEQLSAVQQRFYDKLHEIRNELNRTCYLSLVDMEFHYALYPSGSFYVRHLDQFRSDNRRLISVLLYLNEDWKEEDGGTLRLYLEQPEQGHIDIMPEAGNFVMFRSSELEHEVLPTQRTRYAVVGWMKTHATGFQLSSQFRDR